MNASTKKNLGSFNDPILDEFVEKLIEVGKASIGAASKQLGTRGTQVARKSGKSSIGEVVARRIQKLPADRRAKAIANLAAADSTGIRSQKLAKHARAGKDVSRDPTVLREEFAFLNRMLTDETSAKRMVAGTGVDAKTSGATATRGGAVATEAKPITTIEVLLHDVHCVEETDGMFGKAGRDDVALGGVFVNASGSPTTRPEFTVGKFNSGDRKRYSPACVLHTYVLANQRFPKAFLAFFALAEKDSTGLSAYIAELYESIKEQVEFIAAALGTAAGAAIGAAIGASAGSVVPVLGTLIGLAIGATVGALVDWLMRTLKDDVFLAQSSAISLEESTSRFEGSLESERMSIPFDGHGGRYVLEVSWRLGQ